MLKKLTDLINLAKSKETRRLAVAAAHDEPVLVAVNNAMKEGIISPILVGKEAEIKKIAENIGFDLTNVLLVNEENDVKACKICVKMIRDGAADILMKGLVATAPILKAVLDKEEGLRKAATLSHFALYESPYYHKLLGVTDAAMNVAPEFPDKVNIVKNAVEAMHGVGVECPKVAILGPVEVVNPKIESTAHAAMLTMMNRRKQITGCLIDGPFALDNAVSVEACKHKKIETEVGGDADILVAHDLNSANILYKCLGFLGGATSAAVIMGAKCPIVLTSRADSEEAKLLSIAFAAAM
jgi:phosphate butyryltransferase